MNPFFDAAAGAGIAIIFGAASAYCAGLISETLVYTVAMTVCTGMGVVACFSDAKSHGLFAKVKAADGTPTSERVEYKLVT